MHRRQHIKIIMAYKYLFNEKYENLSCGLMNQNVTFFYSWTLVLKGLLSAHGSKASISDGIE